MGRFDYEDERPGITRQRDFVLNMNEFAHILNKTDGSIKTGLSKGISLDDCEEFYSDMKLLFGDVS